MGNEVVKKRILSQIVKQIQTGCPSLTRALGNRVGPDFAGRDGRKTGSWEEGSQQGTLDRCAPFQIVVRAGNLKLPLTTDLGGWR